MKKNPIKRTVAKSKTQNKNRFSKTFRAPHRMLNVKSIHAPVLDREILEVYRDIVPDERQAEPLDTSNWSEEQDRGEDLATMKDPFVQGPERDTQIPPELSWKGPGKTPKVEENLADQFDAERRSPPL